MFRSSALLMILCNSNAVAVQCLKNADIGWREGNIYSCDDPSYPACCELKRHFTCCEKPSNKHLREQLQLWGTVAFFLLVLLVVYLYYKNDSDSGGCCSALRSFCNICTSGCNKLAKRTWTPSVQKQQYMDSRSEKERILTTGVKKLPPSVSAKSNRYHAAGSKNSGTVEIA